MPLLRLLPALLLVAAGPATMERDVGGFDIAAADGTLVRVATLSEALAAARRRHGSAQVVVTFPPGVLRLTAPIVLDARDSGTVLRASPEGTTLTGAVIVAPAGATRIDDARAAALPGYRFGAAEPTAAPQLFAGEVRLRPAAWPAAGYRQGWTATGLRLRPDDATLPGVSGPLLVSGYFGPGWAWDAIPARVEGDALLLERAPEFGIAPGARLRLSGGLAPAPGRYAPDATGARLGAPAAAPVELAVAPSLLVIDHARHIRIERLTFERSAGTAVRVDEAEDVRFTDCTVRQTGARGIVVIGGHGVTIDRCRIAETGGTAVFLSGGARAELAPSGQAITRSRVSDFGRDVPTAPGLVVWGVGTLVRGNRIVGGGGAAIGLQGNDHRIEANEIAWAACEAEDAGAIYFGRDWTQRGNVIAGNFVHDIGGGRDVQAAGVYLDDQASGASVTRNVFFHLPFGVILGGGRDNRIEGNLFAMLTKASVAFDARGTTWAKALSQPGGALLTGLARMPYRSALWRSRYPALAALPEDRRAEPVGNEMTGNARIEAQPVWSLTSGYTLTPRGDRVIDPGRAELDVIDRPDRERSFPLLARLAGVDPAPAWRTVPTTGVGACPR